MRRAADDHGTTWEYLPEEVRDEHIPVMDEAVIVRADRGFRIAADATHHTQAHTGGCFRHPVSKVGIARSFPSGAVFQDEILSFRLVHDREEP